MNVSSQVNERQAPETHTTTGRLNKRTQELAVLARVAQLLTSLELNDVLSNTLRLLTDTVGAERGSFILLDEEGRTLQRFIARRDLSPHHSQQVVGRVLREGLAGWVYRQQQGAIVEDTQTDDRWVTFPDDDWPVRSVLCVPFLSDGHINGIMTLEHTEPHFFHEDNLVLAMTVANQATVVIRNAQLFDRVETQERKLRAVLQSTREPMITLDSQKRVQMVNPSALAMIGLEDEAVVIGAPLVMVSLNPLFHDVVMHIEAGDMQFDVRDETTRRDYAVTVSSWQEGKAETSGYVMVFNDITSLKEVSRLKSHMLQMASHDLKNPLGIILGYADLLRMDLPTDDSRQEYVQGIARTTDRMLKLISDLLNLERIEAGVTGEDHASLSPIELIQNVVRSEEVNALVKHQSLLMEVDEELPHITGDEAQLHEAMSNLVNNAIKYTDDGGFIIVRGSVDDGAGRFLFSVEDTGLGIPEDAQGHLFEQFFRAKQPGTEDIPGTGLGLSLVKAVVDRHCGGVWFRTVAGEGSIFGFWLPLDGDGHPKAE